jgi:hypothetical protein
MVHQDGDYRLGSSRDDRGVFASLAKRHITPYTATAYVEAFAALRGASGKLPFPGGAVISQDQSQDKGAIMMKGVRQKWRRIFLGSNSLGPT